MSHYLSKNFPLLVLNTIILPSPPHALHVGNIQIMIQIAYGPGFPKQKQKKQAA